MLDFGHVMTALTKLDHSSDELVLLTSRDETAQLAVSYRDLRKCIDTALKDLMYKKTRIVDKTGWADDGGGDGGYGPAY